MFSYLTQNYLHLRGGRCRAAEGSDSRPGTIASTTETRLADIMLQGVIAVPAAATVLDACEFFMFHRGSWPFPWSILSGG